MVTLSTFFVLFSLFATPFAPLRSAPSAPMAPIRAPTTPTGRVLYKIPVPELKPTAKMEKAYQASFFESFDEAANNWDFITAITVNAATTETMKDDSKDICACKIDDIPCLSQALMTAVKQRLISSVKHLRKASFDDRITEAVQVASNSIGQAASAINSALLKARFTISSFIGDLLEAFSDYINHAIDYINHAIDYINHAIELAKNGIGHATTTIKFVMFQGRLAILSAINNLVQALSGHITNTIELASNCIATATTAIKFCVKTVGNAILSNTMTLVQSEIFIVTVFIFNCYKTFALICDIMRLKRDIRDMKDIRNWDLARVLKNSVERRTGEECDLEFAFHCIVSLRKSGCFE